MSVIVNVCFTVFLARKQQRPWVNTWADHNDVADVKQCLYAIRDCISNFLACDSSTLVEMKHLIEVLKDWSCVQTRKSSPTPMKMLKNIFRLAFIWTSSVFGGSSSYFFFLVYINFHM